MWLVTKESTGVCLNEYEIMIGIYKNSFTVKPSTVALAFFPANSCLWHMCLGHCSDKIMSKFAEYVHELQNMDLCDRENCYACKMSKLASKQEY